MDNKVILTLTELIEHSSEANKLLVSNAIAMEDGDLAKAQKYLKEASSLLSVMIKDIFSEVKELLISVDDEEDYDFSTLDIAKLLAGVSYNASCLISCILNEDSNVVKENVQKKLLKNINAVTALTESILLN
jgi:hypothetical protein